MDIDRFKNTTFEKRTEDVPVPALKDFFDKGDEPVFKIRGLSGPELAEVHAAVDKYKDVNKLIEGLLSDDMKAKIEAIKESMGITEKTPIDFVRRIEMFKRGMVDPVADDDFTMKYAENFPVDFYHVTNRISNLSGLGSMPGKSRPSGKTKK